MDVEGATSATGVRLHDIWIERSPQPILITLALPSIRCRITSAIGVRDMERVDTPIILHARELYPYYVKRVTEAMSCLVTSLKVDIGRDQGAIGPGSNDPIWLIQKRKPVDSLSG